MKIKDLINSDLKTALLAGDKEKATILRGIKGAILDEEITQNKRESGLSDEEIQGILSKEVKKRKESLSIYTKAGEAERASKENREIDLIKQYLPEEMAEEEIEKLVNEEISKINDVSMQQMGSIIGSVKKRAGASADGALIAAMIKEKLAK